MSYPLKPVCVKCGLFYRPEKNGYMFEEGMPIDSMAAFYHANDRTEFDGKSFAPNWKSYKIWRGDKWRCVGCENEIVVGFANCPISEHYMGDYQQLREKLIEAGELETFVSDC